ncbi:MAG: hypothetical protein MUF04_13390 [Akkermansiaceae bacterium]|jgi:hypothetical protein|nr:hypothetical protein [Akkermansiaceae bacterium]
MLPRIILGLATGAIALISASCCCTSDSRTPGLPPLPQFRDLDGEPAPAPAPPPQVRPEK